MFVNLFCNYLVCIGKLNSSQSSILKATQYKKRVRLGMIAVKEKMLTEQQVVEINRKQKVLDQKFGDIAKSLGYLDDEALDKLLSLQGSSYMSFCQNALDLGYLSLDETEKCFSDFSKLLGLNKEAEDALKNNEMDSVIPYFVPVSDPDYVEFVVLAVRTFSRIISNDIFIEKGTVLSEYRCKNASYQMMSGDRDTLLGISGDSDSLIHISSIISETSYYSLDSKVLDSVGEFINIINGLFAASLSYRKTDINMLQPVSGIDEIVIKKDKIVVIPVIIDSYRLELFFSLS